MKRFSATIKTVGDLRKTLEDVPDDIKIVRVTNGYYQVKKDDVVFHFGLCKQDERRPDEFPGEVLAIFT